MYIVKEERKPYLSSAVDFHRTLQQKIFIVNLCSQNIQTVQRGSSGVCCVQSALLSLLWTDGERPIQGHH